MSQAEVIGADARADVPDLEARVAVQREDAVDVGQAVGGDDVERAAGLDLLGGLEDQPHASGQAVGHRGQREPAPSSTAVCASWPHMWAMPGTCETHGTSACSCSGRASMSARSATVRDPEPMSQIRPVPGSSRGASPADSRTRAHSAVVACSARASSGCAWMARRQPTTSAACPVSHASSHRGPEPLPRSVTSGRACAAPESSGRVCSSVTVPPPRALRTGPSGGWSPQDASIRGAPEGIGRRGRRGVRTMLSVAGCPHPSRDERWIHAGHRVTGNASPLIDRRTVAPTVTEGAVRLCTTGQRWQGRTGGATDTVGRDAIMEV